MIKKNNHNILEYKINSDKFDLHALNVQINKFAKDNLFTSTNINHVELVTEEILQMLPLNTGVDYQIEFSEQEEEIVIVFKQYDYMQSVIDDNNCDEISNAIIGGICFRMESRVHGDAVEVKLVIKK